MKIQIKSYLGTMLFDGDFSSLAAAVTAERDALQKGTYL
jgi:hypothetical protein